MLGLATVSPFPISWFYHKDIFPSLCYNGSIKRKEMVMCPRCAEFNVQSKLVTMVYPHEKDGVYCPMCTREWWHQEPEPWEPEKRHGMRDDKIGVDVYTTSDDEMRKR